VPEADGEAEGESLGDALGEVVSEALGESEGEVEVEAMGTTGAAGATGAPTTGASAVPVESDAGACPVEG